MRKLLTKIQGKGKSSARGTTIIELILYMGILSILLGILSSLFSIVIDAQLDAESTSDVQLDGRYVMAKLSYDIHRASTITLPDLGDQNASLEITINGTDYLYSLDGNGDLVVNDGAETNKLNGYGTSVTELSFQQLGTVGGKNTIRIEYTMQSRTQDARGYEIQTFTTSVGQR